MTLAAVMLQSRTYKENEKDLAEIFPLWKLEQNCLLSKKGDITIGLRLELPEIFTLSDEEYEALHFAWLKAIKVLPAGTIFHKQDWFTQERYKPDSGADPDNFLMRSSDRFFNERPFLAHQSFVFITLVAADRKPVTSAFSSLLKKSMVPSRATDKVLYQKLKESIGQFSRILDDSGFMKVSLLSSVDLVGNGKQQGIIENYLNLSGQGYPVLKDITFKPNLKIGGQHCLLFSLADADKLPAQCSPRINYEKYATDRTRFSVGFSSPIGQLLPVNHIYNQFMVIGDSPKTLKEMEAKRRRLQSLSTYSRENLISRDATAEFLNEAISQARTPIRAHFNLMCWTDKEDDLKEIRNTATAALAAMEVIAHEETVGAPQLWWAGIAGNEAELPDNECFHSFAEQASCFLNMETAYRSSQSPFGIRLGDRLTGVPLHVDISDEPMQSVCTNRNKLVVGGSGSGKSMFMCHLTRSYVQQGAHCVILDVGHSYEGLCKLLGGYYFTYTEENPIKFNPFYIGPGDVLDTEKKESIKTLLVGLWKANDESFRRSEYVAVSNSLQSFYNYLDRDQSIFPCFDSYYEFLQNHFIRELEGDKVKDRDFDMHNFLYVLRPFYKGGEFDYILNARENLDVLRQPFVVLELDNIKDHPILFSIVTLLAAELFISKMRNLKGVRKVIVIEEAWKAIAKAGMAEFIKYLYKTVRKYFGEAIVVTQEIDDLITSPIIKEAIINNADCKILLDLKKFTNKFDSIQATLGMTNKGRDLVLSLNRAIEPGKRYREIYIELGNTLMKVYRFEPSPEEYYAYSTEQKDKLKVQQYTERYGGDIKKGLRELVKDMAA